MSFRTRILVLVALVAVTAVGATAYLAFREAAGQLDDAATADVQTTQRIVDRLADHARQRGSWDSVPQVVEDQAHETGQRIKLVTDGGDVLADSDTLGGGPARDVAGSPLLVDPRPSFTLPAAVVTNGRVDPAGVTLRAIAQYRSGIALAQCLSQQGVEVAMSVDDYGIPEYSAAPNATAASHEAVNGCYQASTSAGDSASDAGDQVRSCREAGRASRTPGASPREVAEAPAPERAVADCLERAFAEQTSDVGPPAVRLYVGAIGDRSPSLAAAPVAAAAGLVALLALAGTVVLSRRMLRPISAMTVASRRLATGDLAGRVPVQGHDELAQLALSFNDMADSLQRAEDRQRRLIADVAHEMRTPLANLRGYLEALKDGVIPPDQRLFADLHHEASLQQRIVDDLQDLARAEVGALTYHRSPTDLAELLHTCIAAHHAAADAAGVTLRAHVGEPVIVDADPDRLRQAIGNLISNSLRATPAGGTVTLEAGDAHEAGWATVAVHDTGTGITADDLPHIFDRFWRADTARTRHTGGSGLGLTITRQIITDHRGQITATSQPGVGTTIRFTLPTTALGIDEPR